MTRTVGSSRGPECWVIDWDVSSSARRLLLPWLSAARMSGARPSGIVVHAPGGGLFEVTARCRGWEVFLPQDVLTDQLSTEIDDWTVRRSMELVSERGVFPEDASVPFGPLNLLDVQNRLHRYRTFTVLGSALADKTGAGRVRILSADRPLVQAVTAALEGRGLVAKGTLVDRTVIGLRRVVGPPRGSGSSSHRSTAARDFDEALETCPPVETLMVSWTRPMAETLTAVAGALPAAGLDPPLLLHYSDEEPDRVGFLGVDLREVARRREEPVHASNWQAGQAFARSRLGDAEEAPVVLPLLRGLCRERFDLQVAHARLVSRVLDHLRPGVVVVGNDRWWVGQSWVREARRRGVRSICVQDGVSLTSDAAIWGWLTADRIATTGARLRDLLVERGVDADRCSVTGQPRYDRLLARAGKEEQRAAQEALGWSEARMHVLFATQYGQDPAYVREVAEAILGVPGVHLALRPHPSEPSRLHAMLADGSEAGRVTLARDASIEDLLCACDVLVAEKSTVAVEADLLGRRVVLANFSGMPVPENLTSTRAVIVRSADALRAALGAFDQGDLLLDAGLGDPYFVGPTDGRASRRVADLIAATLRAPTSS